MTGHAAGWVPDTRPGEQPYEGRHRPPAYLDHAYVPADSRNPSSGGCVCGQPWHLHPAGLPTTEESVAMAGVRLCMDCRANHFKAYPEFPDEPCMLDHCQCWCTA